MTEHGTAQAQDGASPERRTARHRILHLSDTCLAGARESTEDQGPPAADVLDGLLHDARFVRDVDLVVLSGDVCSDGSSTTYAAARRRVGSFAAGHDALHVYALGDRDDHVGFAEVLGSGHLGPDDLDIGTSGPEGERRGWCSEVDGLRVITLDTTVPGARHGQLGEDQAQWLAEVLGTPAPHGSVLVLHHPPVSPESHRHLAALALRDPERLADVIGGTDVQLVLAGHLGVQLGGTLAGVPVLVAPGVAARTDLTTPEHLDRTVRGAGALVIDLGGPFSPRFHTLWARDPQMGEQLALVDPSSGSSVATEETAAPVDPSGVGSASLSERIPRGESPAPTDRTEAATWPEGLDSSTRSVPPPAAPAPEPQGSDPVWLEDATAASAPAREPSEADVPGPPVALATPADRADPPSPPRPRHETAAPERPRDSDDSDHSGDSDVEDTVLLWALDDLPRRGDPAPTAPGWAPEPDDPPLDEEPDEPTVADAPEPDEGERDDDSGVLSWAFTTGADDQAQRGPRSGR